MNRVIFASLYLLLLGVVCCKQSSRISPVEENPDNLVTSPTKTDTLSDKNLGKIDIASAFQDSTSFNKNQINCLRDVLVKNPNEQVYTINDQETYKRYFGCDTTSLSGIDFSRNTLLIAYIGTSCYNKDQSGVSFNKNSVGFYEWKINLKNILIQGGCGDYYTLIFTRLQKGIISKSDVKLTVNRF
jgi:hypothetical protein